MLKKRKKKKEIINKNGCKSNQNIYLRKIITIQNGLFAQFVSYQAEGGQTEVDCFF